MGIYYTLILMGRLSYNHHACCFVFRCHALSFF